MRLDATYRLQLHRDFTLLDAAALAPWLKDAGFSHLYTSPGFAAGPGSTHGYDVVDPTRPGDEIGGVEGHLALTRRLAELGLGRIADIVPNHMAASSRNAWWWDVLRSGRRSPYARFFDVDWDPPAADVVDRIYLPRLGMPLDRAIEQRELVLAREGEDVVLRYHEHRFPLSRASEEALRSQAQGGAEDLNALLERTSADPAALRALLDRQHYRLASWRRIDEAIGYRRFFDVSTLVGIRVEDEEVFRATHAAVVRWCEEGAVDGLRVDHVDGLRDPLGYLERLRDACPGARVWVEKILHPDERLRPEWPVEGTTGYDFIHLCDGVFVDPRGEEPLTAIYADYTGERRPFGEIALDAKRETARGLLGADLNRLTALFADVAARRLDRRIADSVLEGLLVETAAALPVYRTYARVAGGKACVSDEDRRLLEGAIRDAVLRAERDESLESGVGDPLEHPHAKLLLDVLTLRWTAGAELDLALRFPQFTAPAAAKGIEDTAFYRYGRLLARNEVGGDPARFAVSPAQFHQAMQRSARDRVHSLLPGSTHDTKRSLDVRMRLAVLSEAPDAWRAALADMHARAEAADPEGNVGRDARYVLFQTAVGAWPIAPERLEAVMRKSVREARVHTSWVEPDEAYEGAVLALCRALPADPEFAAAVERLVQRIRVPGRMNSLGAVLLAMTAPGVPDVYQGNELWDTSLVDPDNRRAVDFGPRRRASATLEDMPATAVFARLADAEDVGLPKLLAIRRGLAARAGVAASAFERGAGYAPLEASGPGAGRVLAFLRTAADGGDVRAVTVVPRLQGGAPDLRDPPDAVLHLPRGTWTHAFTGETVRGGDVRIAELLSRAPIALLVGAPR